MYNIIYFKHVNGKEPARDWIKSRDGSIRPNIYRKIEDLKKEGLNLLGTNSLDTISGDDADFYELRNITLNWRIGFYYNREYKSFVLLHGWRHDENHESEHQREIEKARKYLHEYLSLEQRRYG
jgi:hypothetical protein